jgi:Leucine-rich repeat (LRR) protein
MEALQKPRGRIVQFPADMIGTYRLSSELEHETGVEGYAYGEVYVPSGWELSLALDNLSALRDATALGPNDVDELRYAGRSEPSDPLDNDIIGSIGRLSGLRRLNLRYPFVSATAFYPLGELLRLEELHIHHDPLDEVASPTNLLESLPQEAPLAALGLRFFDFNESDVRRVTSYARLSKLIFTYQRTDGTGFAELAALSDLEELTVRGATDEDFAALRALPRLRHLDINTESVTSRVGVYLRHLLPLESLRLSGVPVTDATLDDIGALGNLSELSLIDAPIRRIDAISSLPLRVLNLSRLLLSDAAVGPIGRLSALEDFRLASMSLTDAIAPVLSRLSKLQRLDLNYTQITDRTLDFLTNLPDLRRLDVFATSVSEGAVEQLCRAIPRLVVRCRNGFIGGQEIRGSLASGNFEDLG